jgi:hypothetical protein
MAFINFQPKDYFNTKLFTANASTQSITGVGFQPDMVWGKSRGNAYDHEIYDAVRGVYKRIKPNQSHAEASDTGNLTSFDSDGFSLGSATNMNFSNGDNIVSWNWKANGAGVSNTDGSITSTVSASTTSGFSIVKYTGTGANATVGHGLGVAPKMIIVKNLDNGLGYEWIIGNSDLASGGTGFSANWYFNGFATGARNQNATASWNSTSPTNSVFSLHSGATYMNASGEANIAYCFAEKKGFSKFGSYTGNGNADGSFIFCGFKPAFVMFKRSDGGTENWALLDSTRSYANVSNHTLAANSSNAESSFGGGESVGGASNKVDILSNGIKIREASNYNNTSGATYIFMAFAEEPLVSSNGVPATAR